MVSFLALHRDSRDINATNRKSIENNERVKTLIQVMKRIVKQFSIILGLSGAGKLC